MRGDSDREAQPNHGQVPSEYIRRCLHARGEGTGPNIVEEDAVVQEFLGLIFCFRFSSFLHIYDCIVAPRPCRAARWSGNRAHTVHILTTVCPAVLKPSNILKPFGPQIYLVYPSPNPDLISSSPPALLN